MPNTQVQVRADKILRLKSKQISEKYEDGEIMALKALDDANKKAEEQGLDKMSLEEINSEIAQARK